MLLLLRFLRFLRFFQNPKKRDFLRFFAVLHKFSRTMAGVRSRCPSSGVWLLVKEDSAWKTQIVNCVTRSPWECTSPPSPALTVLELLAFNAQKLGGHMTLAMPHFRKKLRGYVLTVPGNTLVKFEVRSFNHFRAIQAFNAPKLRGSRDPGQ